ncbi:vesicular integral-membrane protein VIP36 isoform X1 [Octopus sinensis]|uniref:Vesicular integral-membrane protein VIP36 isoform X1 n=1 Tax=Octopus sinensis TaxID=2607531 RepID=A0A6P7T1W9_9MOLL|nr:vesicular integral-membrane protein VIP36 isoform X1 [Octopus sinensis]
MASLSVGIECCLFTLLLTIFSTVLGEWNTKDYLKREHTLVKPYLGPSMNIPLWDITGSTMITNNYIRLTSDHQSKQGGIWNSQPVLVRNWELHVQFKVHGAGRTLYGDGFSIWYTRDRMELGPVFGNRDYFSGLAIFLDTYSNHNGPHNHAHPYISAMVNNGSLSYDHDADGTHTELSGCEAQFRNKDHDTHISIRYIDGILFVYIDIDNKNVWKECFTVKGVHLPTGYYVGVSAATGELADNHDILSVKFYELEAPEVDAENFKDVVPSADFSAQPRDHVAVNPSSWSAWKIITLIIIVIGFVIGAFVLIYAYQKHQEGKRKRFY